MAKPYDAATKDLIESDPASLLRYLGFQVSGPVTVQNSDLSTVVAESDRILFVEEDPPWLGHVEIQSSPESQLDLRIDRYSLLIEYRERLPVVSAVLLLRPEADSPSITGRRVCQWPNGEIYREFQYHVVRAWEQSAETILRGPLAMLPLATLAKVPEAQLPGLVEKIEARFSAEEDTAHANQLRTDARILMGLKFSEELINSCPWRTDMMRESTIYQAILREGREDEAKRLLFRLGTKRFGEPSPTISDLVNTIQDREKLEQLTEQILDVASWDELLSK